jgi:hypothetical protein
VSKMRNCLAKQTKTLLFFFPCLLTFSFNLLKIILKAR